MASSKSSSILNVVTRRSLGVMASPYYSEATVSRRAAWVSGGAMVGQLRTVSLDSASD